MKIAFDITDPEAAIIAEQYAYDGSTDKDEFVLEQFKKFGRECILSQVIQVASVDEEAAKKASVEAAKSELSF